MEQRINIAELLKDCPKGTKLYSPIFGDVYLDKIRPHLAIVVTTDKEQGNSKEEFLCDGRYGMNGECMLFPSKDKTTWEGFQKPFKNGDVISNGTFIAIFHKLDEGHMYYHCWCEPKCNRFKAKIDFGIGYIHEYNYATKEEKQKLFDIIKEKGYKWNEESKTLEKLIEPKFKVGDRVMGKTFHETYIIDHITPSGYVFKNRGGMGFIFENEHLYKLVPNKFDITTLKPFDKVLVRNDNLGVWKCNFYSHYNQYTHYYICVDTSYRQCIPFKSNEHLRGKTDDCNEYFKTWK